VIRERRKKQFVWALTSLSLVLGLLILHFFYMDIWVATARFLRLAKKYT
jgi:hypothetical protein